MEAAELGKDRIDQQSSHDFIIHRLLECMVKCNLEDKSVGIGDIDNQSYICSNDASSDGILVVPEHQSRFFLRQDYLEQLQGTHQNLLS